MPVAPNTITLTDAQGQQAERPQTLLTAEDLVILAAYKKLLQRHDYREALYCNRCFTGNREDGTRAQVKTDGLSVEALIECRCRVAYGKGAAS